MKGKLLLLGLLGVLSFACTALHSSSAAALSGSEFRAENIIENSLFFDGGNMSASQIQDFLNSKVPSCDTWGTQIYSGSQTRAQYGASRGNPAPYTCLRNYTENTPSRAAEASLCGSFSGGQKTSAQIIYDVATTCGISPKILLVLLQKEQTLVTDDWPWPIQYRSATGYGCPDTAACDSEYYGFFNQVYNAARIYKKYSRDSSQYNYRAGRYNNIQYNPVAGCGGKSVFIENQATAGLYIYTPYTPNQAALDKLYGSGDSCSAYGNRNFWRMYNDWFGSTRGSLVRTPDSGTLYYTDGANKFDVGSMDMAGEFGLGVADVRFISQQEMSNLQTGQNGYSTVLGYVVKSNNDGDEDGGSIYLISRGRSMKIQSMEQFYGYGFQLSDIRYLPLSLIQRMIPISDGLTSFLQSPSNTVYKIENGNRRSILELQTFTNVSQGSSVSPVSDFVLSRFAFGVPIIEGDAIVSTPSGNIKLFQENTSYDIPSMTVYSCWGFSSIKKLSVPNFDYLGAAKTSAASLGCIAKNSAGQQYLLDAPKKYTIPSAWGVSSSTNVLDRTIDRLPATSTSATAIRKSDGTLSAVENGQKRPIPSMEVFTDLGYNDSSFINISSSVYDSLATGPNKLSPGAPLVEQNGTVSVVTSTNQRLTLTNLDQFINFGFQNRSLYKANQGEATAYSSTGSLPTRFMSNSNPSFADGGKLYSLTSNELQQAYGINSSGLPALPAASLKQLASAAPTRFIRSVSDPKVYYLENGQKRLFSSWQQLVNMGGANQIIFLSDSFVGSIPAGPNLP